MQFLQRQKLALETLTNFVSQVLDCQSQVELEATSRASIARIAQVTLTNSQVDFVAKDSVITEVKDNPDIKLGFLGKVAE